MEETCLLILECLSRLPFIREGISQSYLTIAKILRSVKLKEETKETLEKLQEDKKLTVEDNLLLLACIHYETGYF